jgi:hypothetical protein
MAYVLWVIALILGAIFVFLYFRNYTIHGKLQKALQLRAEERAGRTRREQQVRELAGELEQLKAQQNIGGNPEGKVTSELLCYFFIDSRPDLHLQTHCDAEVLLRPEKWNASEFWYVYSILIIFGLTVRLLSLCVVHYRIEQEYPDGFPGRPREIFSCLVRS